MTTPTTPGAEVSLDSPQASFETVLTNNTVYPETAQRGVGVRGLVPYARFWSEAWFRAAIGDIFSLYDGSGRLLASDSIKSLLSRYPLDVPQTALTDGLVDLNLRVTRVGSGQQSYSRPVKYLIKRTTPGGVDSRPDLPGHDGLRIEPEGLTQYADIDRSYLTNGMWVRIYDYANKRVNDELEVNLGGIATSFTLSPADIAGPWPLRRLIPASVFQQITPFGPVVLLLTVTDVVNNIPRGEDKYSPPFYLNSTLDNSLYYSPVLLVGGVETTRLNLATQGALPLSVVVTPDRSARIVTPPNQIVVTAVLVDEDNRRQTVRLPAKAHLNVRGEEVDASPLADPLRQLARRGGGFVHLSFMLLSAGGVLIGQSGSTPVQVMALQAPATYPAPEFDSKPGAQTVNPQFYPNGTAVRVAYPSMSPAQVIKLNWVFANGTSAAVPVTSGAIAGEVYFSISSQIIAQSANQQINVTYEVTEGTSKATSDIQVLTVQAGGQGQGPGPVATVDVGQSPHYVAITSDGLRAYVSNHISNSVSVIDIPTRKVINTIFGIPSPFQMVLSSDNKRLYVGSYTGQLVSLIDTNSQTLMTTIPVTGVKQIQGLALNGDDSRLFVACVLPSVISVHDTSNGVAVNRISSTLLVDPIGITLNPEKTQIYIACANVIAIAIANANGQSGIVGTIPGVSRPQDIVFNPGNLPFPRAYVTDVDNVRIINPVTNTVVKTLTGFKYAWGAKMHPTARQCYIGSVGPGGAGSVVAYRDSLYVIDTNTEQVINRYAGFDNIAAIAFTPRGDMALLVMQATGKVVFFKTGTV